MIKIIGVYLFGSLQLALSVQKRPSKFPNFHRTFEKGTRELVSGASDVWFYAVANSFLISGRNSAFWSEATTP